MRLKLLCLLYSWVLLCGGPQARGQLGGGPTSKPSEPIIVRISSFGFDTSPALQAALNKVAAHGGTVVLSPGLYPLQIAARLRNAHNVTIRGYGALLKAGPRMTTATSDGDLISIENSDHVTVEGLGFDGNRKSRPFGEPAISLNFYVSNDILVRDCAFKNAVVDDIFMWGGANPPDVSLACQHVQITRCTFDGAGRNAISVVNGAYVRIDHNLIQNVRASAPQAGVDVEPNQGDPPGITHDVLMDNNRIVNCYVGLTAKAADRPSVLWMYGNQIERCTYGIINEATQSQMEWNTFVEMEKFALAGGDGGNGVFQNNTLIRCAGTVIASPDHKIGTNTIK